MLVGLRAHVGRVMFVEGGLSSSSFEEDSEEEIVHVGRVMLVEGGSSSLFKEEDSEEDLEEDLEISTCAAR